MQEISISQIKLKVSWFNQVSARMKIEVLSLTDSRHSRKFASF